MYDPQLEKLVDMALEDGVITEKEKDILVKRAKLLGIDLDEFEMYLDSRLGSLSNTQNTTPSQKKFGDLLKCPSCGASVPSLTIICKDCGFEFRNIKANSSVKELSEKLEQVSNTHSDSANEYGISFALLARVEIIKGFIIPNTKDDLMEFALYLAPKINTYRIEYISEPTWRGLNMLNNTYIEKYQEIILKAKVVGKDDLSLSKSIINLIQSRNIKVSSGFADWDVFLSKVFGFIGVLGSLWLFMIPEGAPLFNLIGLYKLRIFFLTCIVLSVVFLVVGFIYRSKPINWDK